MKEIACKTIPVSLVPAPPALASMHPSYRSAAIQAAAALQYLTTLFRQKNARRSKKTGRA